MVRGLSKVIPATSTLERSAYDQAMRHMHHYMKESEEFPPREVLSRYAAGKSAMPPEIPIGT